MYWFSDLFSELPVLVRAVLGLAVGALLGVVIALSAAPGLLPQLRVSTNGAGEEVAAVYTVTTDEEAEFILSDDVQNAVRRAKDDIEKRATGAHALADKYWPGRDVRLAKHDEALPFPIQEDCVVQRTPPWNVQGRCMICAFEEAGVGKVQQKYPGLSPLCSSQVPGLQPGLALLALEVYVTAHEASERLEALDEMVDFPLSMVCINKVIGFDLALDETVAEAPEEPPPESCEEQSLVFSFEGRQGIVVEDDRALRMGASRTGAKDVRYVDILDDEVGGLLRDAEVPTARLSGEHMTCRISSFERVYWGFEAIEASKNAEDLVCAATRLVAWLDCPETDAAFVDRSEPGIEPVEGLVRQEVSPTLRSKQVGWLASTPQLLDTLASARQLVERIGGGLGVSYEVQRYSKDGVSHTLTEAALTSDRICVQGAFEARVSAVTDETGEPDVRVSFAERVVGLVDWDGDGQVERLVETPWGSRAVRSAEGLVCQSGPPACAVDCDPGLRAR